MLVQGYELTPSGLYPVPENFNHQEVAAFGTDTYNITVPLNSYYGVHLLLANIVDCDHNPAP
jgi:hypothetical protein